MTFKIVKKLIFISILKLQWLEERDCHFLSNMKRSTRSNSVAHFTKDTPKLKKPRTKITDLTDKDTLNNRGATLGTTPAATPDATDDSEALYAITVLEPFATAIVHGPKRLENRKFKLAIPNPQKGRWMAIHAGRSEKFLKDGTYHVVRLYVFLIMVR